MSRYLVFTLFFSFSSLLQAQDMSMPSRAKRVQVLERAFPNLEWQKLDELDQDLLFLRATKTPMPERAAVDIQPEKKPGQTIVFFDLNFAPDEIRAAQDAAKTLGESLLVFPERTQGQQDEIEKQYRVEIGAQDKYKACQAAGAAKCGDYLQQASDAQAKIKNLLSQIHRLDSKELDGIFAKLDAQKVQISDIVFSGHSGGTGFFAGLFGSLDADDLKDAFAKYPALATKVSSILLWGCYSGTLESFYEYWQKNFPAVKAFAGYRSRAPLGIRSTSGRLLKSYLLHEDGFLGAKTLQVAQQIFRSLDLVADLDGAAVLGQWYFSYDQAGKISDLLKVCDSFDVKLLDQFKCYNKGDKGCENPPSSHTGPLRDLYTFLQVNRHCEGVLQKDHPELPSPENLIRLIYMDQVKANFEQKHKASFKTFADYAVGAGMSPEVRMDRFVHSTRAEDRQIFKTSRSDFERLGWRDQSFLDRTDWRNLTAIYNTLDRMQLILGFFMMPEPCVPFSWVEADSPDHDTCGVADYLVHPVSADLEDRFISSFYSTQFNRWKSDTDSALETMGFIDFSTVKDLRNIRQSSLSGAIKQLNGYSSRSPVEDKRLALYTQLLAQQQSMNDTALVATVLAEVGAELSYIDQLLNDAGKVTNNKSALSRLNGFRTRADKIQKILQTL